MLWIYNPQTDSDILKETQHVWVDNSIVVFDMSDRDPFIDNKSICQLVSIVKVIIPVWICQMLWVERKIFI